MAKRLINVRMDEDHLRKVQKLRAKGVALSDLVREAIDQRYALLVESPDRDARAIVARLFEQFPDDGATPIRTYDVHDAGQARAAVRKRLRRSAT